MTGESIASVRLFLSSGLTQSDRFCATNYMYKVSMIELMQNKKILKKMNPYDLFQIGLNIGRSKLNISDLELLINDFENNVFQ